MKPELSKHIIIKSFEGQVTPLQQTMIAGWLGQPGNMDLYFLWLDEWERANPQFLPDTGRAFERSLRQYQADSPTPVNPSQIWLHRRLWRAWLVAASVALVVLAGSAWFWRDVLQYEQHQTAYGEVSSHTLSDGSRVVMNANTRLRVPRWNFGTGTREVWLTGEAEFSVRHLPGHQPFIVHTPDGLNVRVLGTEFVVYSRLRGSKVVLNKGRVSLQSDKDRQRKPLVIAPGDVVTLSAQGHFTLRHRQLVSPHTAWKDHRFTFENTSLTEVAYRITEQFGVVVDIPDGALANRKLGGTFKAETAVELLDVVVQMLDARVVTTGQKRYKLIANNS
jgi:transmembrane sensor